MVGPLQSMCGTCRPRWTRLVDNVFPSDPNNREPKPQRLNSLTHYTCRYPEKLGRIANYLERRLQRDLYRRRTGHVFVATSIADNLIKCCQRLDGLVCAYLSMVTSLVECEDRELQILGSASFCAYSAIEKETPNYLSEYAPLLERFVRMCLDSSAVSNKVRCAGLRGIAGLVRKIGSDDLQLNIWQELHMTQIVGAVLFNLEAPPPVEIDEVHLDDEEPLAAAGRGTGAPERPFDLAKEALDELLMRATFHNYACVIGPVLAHLDANPSLWVPSSFALLVFRTLVTRAPRPGYAYTVVERLVGHLNSKSVAASTPVRQCVLQVVSGIVGFAAGDSVGPAVYNVFKELCCQLARSLYSASPQQPAEQQYRQELVLTMSRYAEAAPDTHKLEIMKYLLTYEPPSAMLVRDSDNSALFNSLGLALLSAVAMVADAYRSRSLAVALPMDLLGALLVQEQQQQQAAVLAALLDRQRCRKRLCPQPLPLFDAWPNAADIVDTTEDSGDEADDVRWRLDASAASFPLTRSARQLMCHLVEQLTQLANQAMPSLELAQSLGTCACLLAVQCASPMTLTNNQGLVELHRLWVTAQQRLCSTFEQISESKDGDNKIQDNSQAAGNGTSKTNNASSAVVHAVLASYVSLLGWATPGDAFREHVAQVISQRRKSAPHLLPDYALIKKGVLNLPTRSQEPVPQELLFSAEAAEAALQACGLNTSSLRQPFELLNFASLHSPLDGASAVFGAGHRQRVATFGLTAVESAASMQSNSTPSAAAVSSDANDYLPLPNSGIVQRHDSIWSLNYATAPPTERRASRQIGGSDNAAAAASAAATLDLSFNAFRGIMFESTQERSRRRAREDQQLKELYSSATFEELLERSRRSRAADIANDEAISADSDEASIGVGDISDILRSIRDCDACNCSDGTADFAVPRRTATIKEIEFPSLFAY